MKLLSTSSFRNSLNILCKRPENGYDFCLLDISRELKDKSFEDIFNKHFLQREMGNVRVIKLRIQNSQLNYSSSQGYRLIILCNRNHNHVALLEIYPKKGRYSKSDLTKREYKDLMNFIAGN